MAIDDSRSICPDNPNEGRVGRSDIQWAEVRAKALFVDNNPIDLSSIQNSVIEAQSYMTEAQAAVDEANIIINEDNFNNKVNDCVTAQSSAETARDISLNAAGQQYVFEFFIDDEQNLICTTGEGDFNIDDDTPRILAPVVATPSIVEGNLLLSWG
jgi:hypothetical protein